MNISNIKIGTRLLAGFSIILGLMGIMIVVGLLQLANVGNTAQVMTEQELVKERLTNEWVSNGKQNGIRTFAALKSTDAAMLAMYQEQIKETSSANKDIVRQLDVMLEHPRAKALFEASKQKQQAYQQVRDQLFALRDQGVEPAVLDARIKQDFIPSRAEYFDSMNAIAEFERQLINEAGDQIQKVRSNSSIILLILGAIAIVAGIIMALSLSSSITKPLSQAVDMAKAVANGDLTSHVKPSATDEIGELLAALELMNQNLSHIVGDVRHGAETIATASQEIATGNLDLSSRTEEQASSLEETASAMEQLTSTVKQNADNAHQANQFAVSASAVASTGSRVIDDVIGTMSDINDASKRIADIIAVIDGIAFQTNILALNAAVEAARAGEQGRGFAVVATEVRTLAQRAASAAKEIKGLITDSVSKVQQGSDQVQKAGNTMREIRDSVERVKDMVSDIAAASHEQSTGIEQVNQAIMQMDEVTQQNAALVEEAAAASQSLQDQAQGLKQAVSVFRLDRRAA